MKKFLLATVFSATFALLAACGDDVTEVTEIHQDGMAVLDAGLELSKQKCDTTNVGDMLFVTDSSEVFVCEGKNWLTLKGADGIGKDGSSCTAKPVKDSAGLEGLEVTCGETVVGTIWNGEKGEPGADGEDGNDGGDGKNCEVSREGNVLTITCVNSVVTIDLDELIQASSSSAEIGSSSAEGSSSSEEESSSSNVIASSSSAEESSSSEEVSSSSEEESSSSSVIASSSSAKQSSSSFEVSSSSEEESSSSEEESSSSVVFPEGVMSAGYYENHCPAGHTCKDAAPSTYLKSGITYGEILDTRDDQVYKVVTIGTQTWMAQNLNYDPGNVSSMGEYAWSGCYDDAASNCSKYGRLYTWAAAIDSVALANDADDLQTCGYGETCTLPTVVQGICPEGWHLPTYAEWDTLITNVGGENVAGRMLKSEEGWNYYPESTKGIDYYGLSALPAGSRSFDGFFFNAGYGADFWSSSEDGSDVAYTMYLYYHYENVDLYYGRKNHANSVRCLKD